MLSGAPAGALWFVGIKEQTGLRCVCQICVTDSPDTRLKCRILVVYKPYPSSSAVTPINKSARGMRSPRSWYSPSSWPVRSAMDTVTGYTGIAARSSWMNLSRRDLRSGVSARAAPCANSISVTTETPTSISPIVCAIAVKTCRAFWPWRSAAIKILESRISPMREV